MVSLFSYLQRRKIMKIFTILILGILLVSPVWAMEYVAGSVSHEYGLNLRTRFVSQQKFSGQEEVKQLDKAQASQDLSAQMNFLTAQGMIPGGPLSMKGGDDNIGDLSYFDIRARFYYTATIHDNFRIITKADISGVLESGGESDTRITEKYNAESDTGTDDADLELIHFYFDFNPDYKLGPFNVKAGLMPSELAHGLICNDESVFQAQAIWQASRSLYFPITYTRNDNFGIGKGDDRATYDIFTVNPIFFSRNTFVSPFYTYTRARDKADTIEFNHFKDILSTLDRHDVGLDVRVETERFSLWFAGVRQFGSMTLSDSDNVTGLVFAGVFPATGEEVDFEGWALNCGGNIEISPSFDIHSEFIYATGEEKDADDPSGLMDKKQGQFLAFKLTSHPWAEIMGSGMFGNQVPAGSPGDEISDIVAYGLGVTYKPTDKLSFRLDGWYAELEEKNAFGEKNLGTEINLKTSYELPKGLNVDIVAAYLFADDATSTIGTSTDDPYEIGVQLTCDF